MMMASFSSKMEEFLKAYEDLRAIENEEAFAKEFMNLKAQSQRYRENNTYPAESGQLPINRRKNRFKDIIPFEYTRVSLHAIEGIEGSDYVNANYIQGPDGKVTYIAAQGPLPHTVNDFWRMLWYHNIEIVIMACKLIEMAKPKCECYWPELNETKSYGPITVTTTYEENISNDFVIRDFMAECEGEQQHIRQYHYLSWPDHGRPKSPQPVIRMIEMIHDYRTRLDIPLLVHCSAGCGRTGTIVAIDIARTMVLTKTVPQIFSPYQIVEEMRKQRPAMVQAKEQYIFVYMAMAELAGRALGNQPQPPPKPDNKTQSSSNNSVEVHVQVADTKNKPPAPAATDDLLYENISGGAPKPLPRSITPTNHPQALGDKEEKKKDVVPPPRAKQGYENVPKPATEEGKLSPTPKPRFPRTTSGGNGAEIPVDGEGKKKPVPPPKQDAAEAEPDYSPVDMTQIKDTGPDICVVDEKKKKRAPLKAMEEEFEKRKAEEVSMTPSGKKSIFDTFMDALGSADLSDEEEKVPSPPPPTITTSNKWSLSDEVPPPIPLHTTASTQLVEPSTNVGSSDKEPAAGSGVYMQPTLHSIPMPRGETTSHSTDLSSQRPPPIDTSSHPSPAPTPPAHTALSPPSSGGSGAKGSRLTIGGVLRAIGGKSKSEKRKPITASDISGPTGLTKSPSDHGLSRHTSPPRHSPSPDHTMPSHAPSRGAVKNLSESFGISQAGPANTRYTFPGEIGYGLRVEKPKGPRPEPPHWKVLSNSLTVV